MFKKTFYGSATDMLFLWGLYNDLEKAKSVLNETFKKY